MRKLYLPVLAALSAATMWAGEPLAPTEISNGIPRLRNGHYCQTKGDVHFLVVLTEFSDVPYTTTYLPIKPDGTRETLVEFFTRYFNEPGFVNPFEEMGGEKQPGAPVRGAVTGSVRDYWLQSSNGQFRPVFDVYGVYKIGKQANYGGNSGDFDSMSNISGLAEAGFNAVKNDADLSLYDHDGDGILDNILTIFSGQPENNGGGANAPWTVHVALTEPDTDCKADGVVFQQGVNASVERKTKDPSAQHSWDPSIMIPSGYGYMVHEFAHALGMPDLYKTQGVDVGYTLGQWLVMDDGLHNNVNYTPCSFSALERYIMDWMDPVELVSGQMAELEPVFDTNEAFAIRAPQGQSTYPELYILENRRQEHWDTFIPGHGMLVYHVEQDPERWAWNNVNGVKAHQCADLVEADGMQGDDSRKGDPFPGEKNVTSLPDFPLWNGGKLPFSLTNIAENDRLVTFSVNTGSQRTEIPTPAEATQITGDGFTANWDGADADEYLISVYTKGHLENVPYFADGWQKRRCGATNEVQVSGLQPDTQYYYRVKAVKGGIQSRYSDEVAVRTGSPSSVGQTAAKQALVYATPGRITVQGSPAEIFDLSGRRVATLADGATAQLPSGVYVVRTRESRVKAAI